MKLMNHDLKPMDLKAKSFGTNVQQVKKMTDVATALPGSVTMMYLYDVMIC